METRTKSWEDETIGKSYMENINFDIAYVYTIELVLEGLDGNTNFDLTLSYSDKQEKINKTLKSGKKSFIYKVDDITAVSISGHISPKFFGFNCKGKVSLTVQYDPVLKSSSSWHDSTAGISVIENLFLDNTEEWDSFRIEFLGKKNHYSNIDADVIIDGALYERYDIALNGTESVVKQIRNIKSQVPILITGHINPDSSVIINLDGAYLSESNSRPTLPALDSEYENRWNIASSSLKIEDGKLDLTQVELESMGLTEIIDVFEVDSDAGFIARSKDGDLCICFRGSDSNEDYITDAEFKLTDLIINKKQYGKVHRGFLNSVNNIIDRVKNNIKPSDKSIKLYGHSKGAAMATITAKILEVSYKEADIEVFAFASPRVGDKDFKKSYSLNHTRYELFLDIVPHLPLITNEITIFEDYSMPFSIAFNSDYTSVGTRVLLLSDNYENYNVKTPYITSNKKGETLNSFIAILDLLRNNSLSIVNDIHNNYDIKHITNKVLNKENVLL